MEYIKGRLAEDGQTVDFPVIEEGAQRPFFRAVYHASRPQRTYNVCDNLLYLVIPTGTMLELDEQEMPVPFIQKGEIKDIRRFRLSPTSVMSEGLTLAKIPPQTGYRVKALDRTNYHSFEMLETPDSYKNPDSMHFDFMWKDEANGLAVMERGNRILRIGKVTLFPDYCAYRLPGWLAKEFNGSPEFGFSYSRFTEPRPGEVLHSHQEVMEPYIGLEGDVPLFVEIGGGSEKLKVVDTFGVEKEYKGELVNIGKGDVVLPLPFVPHRILFDERARFPFTQYCINYSARGLDKTPSDDRVLLEK